MSKTAADHPFIACGFPKPGERVLVQRKSGKTEFAQLGIKPDATFRSPENMHWLNDDGKFADVEFDPIVNWAREK